MEFANDRRGAPTYTILDLGLGRVDRISEVGTAVGGSNDQPTLWEADGTPVLLGRAVGIGAKHRANGISPLGRWIAGSAEDSEVGQLAVRWDLTTGTTATLLPPVPGHDQAMANGGINDLGQAVGQSFLRAQGVPGAAALWEPDGTVVDLGGLPGSTGSWARGINNAGHIVGVSHFYPVARDRAVLWLQDGGGWTAIDLTPNSDGSCHAQAVDVTQVSSGLVQIVGTSGVEGSCSTGTVWTVDVQTQTVIDEFRSESGVAFASNDINGNGEVAVMVWGGSGRIWTPSDDVLWELPGLPGSSDRKCGKAGIGGINDAGAIGGSSSVLSKGKCVAHAVIWTRIGS